MPEVADDQPSLAEYEPYLARGDLWVVADPPVAFVIVEMVDGNAHVDELSVDPQWSRRGIGRALLDHVTSLAEAGGLPAVTLTTFVSVPWNAPYYRRLGFEEIPESAVGRGVASILARERRHFTGSGHARVAMRRAV
jgi:ribosomal protein S18 acetylase RimI-like enzyme